MYKRKEAVNSKNSRHLRILTIGRTMRPKNWLKKGIKLEIDEYKMERTDTYRGGK